MIFSDLALIIGISITFQTYLFSKEPEASEPRAKPIEVIRNEIDEKIHKKQEKIKRG